MLGIFLNNKKMHIPLLNYDYKTNKSIQNFFFKILGLLSAMLVSTDNIKGKIYLQNYSKIFYKHVCKNVLTPYEIVNL